ncbi:hypothetical protein HDU91_001128, partial [Kappamyces sp. JEL0680]
MEELSTKSVELAKREKTLQEDLAKKDREIASLLAACDKSRLDSLGADNQRMALELEQKKADFDMLQQSMQA